MCLFTGGRGLCQGDPSPDRDPINREPIWTETETPLTETPSGQRQRPPLDRDPSGQGTHLDRDPWTETSQTETLWTEIPMDRNP